MALRNRIALLVAALSLAATVAGATSALARAEPAPKLTIAPTGHDQYRLVASATVDGYYPSGVDIAVRLWGEDEWFDDLLYTVPGTSFQNRQPVEFERAFTVSGSVLNEDWGWDEIYVEIRLYDHRTGKLARTIETNRLYGQWS